MDTSTNVLLSIKPKYAQAIISGTKKVEFRKKIFKRPISKIYIYSSSPTKKIIGYFTFSRIIEETPSKLWTRYKSVGGIDKEDFFDYFQNNEKGFAIVIDHVEKFKKEIDPIDIFDTFNAPQSYFYVKGNLKKSKDIKLF